MLTAEAHVQTERPSRYLVQLCRHAHQMGQRRLHRARTHGGGDTQAPPEVQHVEWSDTHGIVRLSLGQWTMEATPDTLTLRAEATNEKDLQRIQDLVAGRLEMIGRRDRLTVTWQRPDAPTLRPGDTIQAGDPGSTEQPRHAENTTRGWRLTGGRSSLTTLGVIGALAIAAHLGLGGAVLAASRWTYGVAIGLVAVVVLVKVIGLGLLTTRHRHRRIAE
jgi:hypothetical protein